ncbi:hypothetical protein LZ554_004331 [Drepanopeziza brunnea f. sp. 'monogermtubi']|nr:hypothetical protein LZ554_004331 [Drepanopeziza brunnea f. sp. 'monogermtubi']
MQTHLRQNTYMVLIILSMLTVVTCQEEFNPSPQSGIGTGIDDESLGKRDTITLDMPWNPPKPSSAIKAVNPPAGSVLDAVEKVAAALLNGGSDIAGIAQSAASGLTYTVVPLASGAATILPSGVTDSVSSVPVTIQEVSGGLGQATGVAGSIVSAATGIVGVLMGTGSSRASMATGVLSSEGNGTGVFTSAPVGGSWNATNASSATSAHSLSFNVTSAPSLLNASTATSTPSLPFNITSAPSLSNASSARTTPSLPFNVSSSPSLSYASGARTTPSLPFNITSAPSLSNAASSTAATSSCPSASSCTVCPPPTTETCTVTETWHSTHYEETATLFSFVAAVTATSIETVSVCPVSQLYPVAPTPSLSSPQPAFVACANGVLAQRAEECPPTSSITNATIPNPSVVGSYGGSADSAGSASSSHPCPNAGYSCSECPDGVFCPPSHTSAQSAPCGFGWACGHCSQGWFCVPSPTAGPTNDVLKSAASVLVGSSGPGFTSGTSTVPLTMASFTASRPSLIPAVSLVTEVAASTESLQAFRTSSVGPLSQATAAADLANSILNNVMGEVNSALGNFNGLSEAILSSVMGRVSSAFGAANSALGVATSSAAGGGLLSSATSLAGGLLSNGAAAGSTAALGLVPSATSLAGDIASNAVSTGAAALSNLVSTTIPLASPIVGAGDNLLSSATVLAGGVLSNGAAAAGGLIPSAISLAGNAGSDTIPAATGAIGDVASNAIPNSVPALTVAALAGSVQGATHPAILASVAGNTQSASLPVPAQIVPTTTAPVFPLPALGGVFREVSSGKAVTAGAVGSVKRDEPNVISRLTMVLDGTKTVLPVVITIIDGKPTVVPLVRAGSEVSEPLLGVEMGGIGERVKVGAVAGIFAGSSGGGGGKRRRRGRDVEGEKEVEVEVEVE